MPEALLKLWPLVQLSLLWGLALSAILFPLVLAILRFNPEIMLKDYPPGIRAAYGPMSERTRRQRPAVVTLFMAVLLAVVFASVRQVREAAGGDLDVRPLRPMTVHIAGPPSWHGGIQSSGGLR